MNIEMNTLHYIINNVFRQKQVYLFFNSWTPLFSFVFYKMMRNFARAAFILICFSQW